MVVSELGQAMTLKDDKNLMTKQSLEAGQGTISENVNNVWWFPVFK